MTMQRVIPLAILVAGSLHVSASAARLDEFPLDRWAKLRETERYQLKIAEKYFLEKKWKVAAAEYEKYLLLHEQSEAAAYSQLKWSICQREMRQLNTAIKEGFQSVVDYWPDSPEAIVSAFYIGRTYKDMGEVAKAKQALKKVVADHSEHLAAVYAAVDLIDIADIEKDPGTKVSMWEQLAFETSRTRESEAICQKASRDLAVHRFRAAAFEGGVESLATTYDEASLPAQVLAHLRSPIAEMMRETSSQPVGRRLADQGIAWFRGRMPAATDEATELRAREHWYAIADLHSVAQRDPQVVETFQAIEKQLGADDATLVRLGTWFKSRNRHDEARKTFARLKNAVEANNQVAVSFRDEKNYDAAVVAFRNNVPLDPDNGTKWLAAVASTYHDYARRYDDAINVYNELLKADVENTNTWMYQIARAHQNAGRYKQAIGFYRQCTNFPSNYWEMANCHRALKEYDEAVVIYNQIVGGSQSWAPRALIQIGYTFEQAGKKEQAIASFQQVCRRFPKDSHASQAHAHLQNEYKISVTLGGAKTEE